MLYIIPFMFCNISCRSRKIDDKRERIRTDVELKGKIYFHLLKRLSSAVKDLWETVKVQFANKIFLCLGNEIREKGIIYRSKHLRLEGNYRENPWNIDDVVLDNSMDFDWKARKSTRTQLKCLTSDKNNTLHWHFRYVLLRSQFITMKLIRCHQINCGFTLYSESLNSNFRSLLLAWVYDLHTQTGDAGGGEKAVRDVRNNASSICNENH